MSSSAKRTHRDQLEEPVDYNCLSPHHTKSPSEIQTGQSGWVRCLLEDQHGAYEILMRNHGNAIEIQVGGADKGNAVIIPTAANQYVIKRHFESEVKK